MKAEIQRLTFYPSLAKRTSIACAIFIGALIEIEKKYQLFGENTSHAEHGEGWLPMMLPDAERLTGLTWYNQDKAIKVAISHGLLEKKMLSCNKNNHFKRHIRLNKRVLENFIN